MAILGMHSFDYGYSIGDYGGSYWDGNNAHVSSSTVSRTGPRSLRLQCYGAFGTPGMASWTLGNVTTAWAQAAYYCSNAQGALYTNKDKFGIFGFWEGYRSINHVSIGWDTSTLQLVASRNGTEIARSTQDNLFTQDTWIFMEVKVVIHDTAGSVLVKLNGTTHIDASNLNTRNGGSGVTTHVVLGTGCTGYNQLAYFDDFMYGNGTGSPVSPPGDSRVEYLVPVAGGAKTQFTPSAGSNWGNVDELGVASDADYNWASEVGSTDVFAMSNLSGNGIVHAVQTVIRARKDDAGFRLVKPAFHKSIGQGDTVRLYTSAAPAVSVGDSFTYSRSLLTASPDTSLAWTVEEIADLQFGYVVGGGSQFSTDAWIAAF